MKLVTRKWLKSLVVKKNSRAKEMKDHIVLLEKELASIRRLIEVQPSDDCLGKGRADIIISNIDNLLGTND